MITPLGQLTINTVQNHFERSQFDEQIRGIWGCIVDWDCAETSDKFKTKLSNV